MMRLSILSMPLPYLLLARHLALLYVVGLIVLIAAKFTLGRAAQLPSAPVKLCSYLETLSPSQPQLICMLPHFLPTPGHVSVAPCLA